MSSPTKRLLFENSTKANDVEHLSQLNLLSNYWIRRQMKFRKAFSGLVNVDEVH